MDILACNHNLSCHVVTQCCCTMLRQANFGLGWKSFSNQPGGFQAVQRQLIGYFTDGLCYDYLQVKIMQENPTTLQAAITLAVTEQNLRKRFQIRSDRDYGSQSHQSTGQFGEPMEVDHIKPMKKCQFCQSSGHTSRFCHKIRDYQSHWAQTIW